MHTLTRSWGNNILAEIRFRERVLGFFRTGKAASSSESLPVCMTLSMSAIHTWLQMEVCVSDSREHPHTLQSLAAGRIRLSVRAPLLYTPTLLAVHPYRVGRIVCSMLKL
eukprot:1394773-Amorphochlora_amoeboformis.AAC.1